MSRIAFHRPARYVPPQLPHDSITIPAPPQSPEGGGAGLLAVILPLLSSVGMAGYMITFGRPFLIVFGALFVIVSIGVAIAMRMQTRSSGRRGQRRQRRRYRAHLDEARAQASGEAAAQRHGQRGRPPGPGAAVVHQPRPGTGSGSAGPDDPDFLQVRLGLGRADLGTPIQLGANGWTRSASTTGSR